MIYILFWVAVITAVITLFQEVKKDLCGYFYRRQCESLVTYQIATEDEKTALNDDDEIAEAIHTEALENYDRQIDGLYKLISLLDTAYKDEWDEKKKAAILGKQIAALEKLNKTIEKREKLL